MNTLLKSKKVRRGIYLCGTAICVALFFAFGDPFYVGRGSDGELFRTAAPVAIGLVLSICAFQEPA